jgi:hypothetical protein
MECLKKKQKKAKINYSKYCAIKNNYPDVKGWKECSKMFANDFEKARKFYHEQDGIKQIKEATNLFLDCPIDYYGDSLGLFIAKRINGVGTPFAVITDGRWFERGSVGWWGCVSNEMGEGEWNKQVSELYNGLRPDTLVSLYDCHI